MQGNVTSNIVVTDKVKAFIMKLGLWVRKLKGKILIMFSRLTHLVEENSVETDDTGIDLGIKNHLAILESRIFTYFLEELNVKYIFFSDQTPC
jgi:hypothetical protein